MNYRVIIVSSIIELIKFSFMYGVYRLSLFYSKQDKGYGTLDFIIAFVKVFLVFTFLFYCVFYHKDDDGERIMNLTDTLTYSVVFSIISGVGLYNGYRNKTIK